MHIDSRTRLVTLLGYPLGHSLSPLIHNTAFQEQGINMVYLCIPVTPEYFETAVRGLGALHFVGSNITIPHKQRAFEIADDLSERARAVSAVNTLVCKYTEEGKQPFIYGDNTDVQGFGDTLLSFNDQLVGGEMTILGSGGSARAVAYALLTRFSPKSLTIAARTVSKAEKMAGELAQYDALGALKVSEYSESGLAVKKASLLVNTTPVGLYPHTTESPWPNVADLSEGQIVYDLIYNPEKTTFLEQAEKRGAIIVGGLEMLIGQAAASYRQWTGQDMPLDQVRSVVSGHLAK